MRITYIELTLIGALVPTLVLLGRMFRQRATRPFNLLSFGKLLLYGGLALVVTYGCIVLFYLIGSVLPDGAAYLLSSVPALLWIAATWFGQQFLLKQGTAHRSAHSGHNG